MLVCQKTTNLFIIFACGLVLLMPNCRVFLTTHVPEIFLVFVWVCGLSVKRSKQGFIYLICQETLIICKKWCAYIHVGRTITIILPFYKFGILNFFGIIYLSLTFLPILQNPSYLGMFWKFLCPSQVGYLNICTIKGRTSKVTAEDGSVPLVVSGIPGIKSFFLTF